MNKVMEQTREKYEEIQSMARVAGLTTRLKQEVDKSIEMTKSEKLEAVIELLVILNDGVD